jgi:TonB family protein
MDRIFTNSPASFGADLPDYWKAFYHLPLSAGTELQVEKMNDPKSSTFKPNLAAVTPPILRLQPEPDFSEEARRKQFSGICMIKMIVDSSGVPRNLAIEQPVGLGLDEKAVDAVSRYRFTPAMKDGQPVAVALKIEVDFHIYNYR